MALDLGSILAGTKYRGEFEERLKRIVEEAQNDSAIIVVIDEIHTLVGAGAAEGAVDAANILKPALARRVAAARPPMPAPITTISPLCSLIFFYLSRKGFHESVESMML